VSEPISILDVIKRGGYEASLITTYNATLPFYEEVILRKLVGAGCRHNVVLMDRAQCAISWSSEATRPMRAGHSYTLLPIGVPGAFHPKLCILVGPKKASILIGSHNLTLSGFGYNREVTNWIEVAGIKDGEGVALLADAWRMASQWIELERGKSPDAMLESALSFSNFVSPLISGPAASANTFALTQIPNGQPLLDQVLEKITPKVKKIGIIGAFFDNELAFIKEIAKRWPSAKIVVGIDPDSVQLSVVPVAGVARYVDARQLWTESKSYLHAKIIYFETGDNNRAFVSGSANPSRPAWLSTQSCNVEAVLLQIGPDAKKSAEATNINHIFGLAELDRKILKTISIRSSEEIVISELIPVPLWDGTANSESEEIAITIRGRKKNFDRVLFLADMRILGKAARPSSDGDVCTLKVGNDVGSIRSCLFFSKDVLVAQAMIHHPSVILASSQSSRQYQIRSALSALGSNDGDISKVIASVERVIFADETNNEIDASLREHKATQAGESRVYPPKSLAISVADLPKVKKKLRLLKSGDLAYLLDVLLRRLSEGLDTATVETDRSGRTEEEQVGQDGENETSSLERVTTAISDIDIAKAVSRRAKALIRKMVAQLELAATDKTRRASAVLQLIAVLALLRELRHLDRTPRWKITGQFLVEEDDRQYLLDESLYYLLCSSTRLLDTIEQTIGKDTDETVQLRVLMLWLAWDLGHELTDQVGKFLDPEELNAKLGTNAMFLNLIPPIAVDNAAQAELERCISRTIRPTPEAALRAQKWLARHWSFGLAWTNGVDAGNDIHVGGFCCVPGNVDEPQVVVELSDRVVGFWDFDQIRRFEKSRVLGVSPKAPS
jgi:hypothetical protein